MDEYMSNTPRSLDGESDDQADWNLEHGSDLHVESYDSETAHLHDVVDQLEYAVQVCSQERIPLPFVLNEVEKALGVVFDDISADWQTDLRLHLVDYVTAAFAKDHLQPPLS
ncbi:hypothetical protein ACFWBG_11815 [Nocardia salmonicida]|uniref:hypothetical protein n=1 Tax=Nocardia salmonicida TaxID=53431 RepID=UPI0036709EFF